MKWGRVIDLHPELENYVLVYDGFNQVLAFTSTPDDVVVGGKYYVFEQNGMMVLGAFIEQ